MDEFSPPFSEFPSFFFFFLITSTWLWFCYIITKLHPPFQNPGGSAPEKSVVLAVVVYRYKEEQYWVSFIEEVFCISLFWGIGPFVPVHKNKIHFV